MAIKRKEHKRFKVSDDHVFEIIERLRKKKDIEVNIVTCTELLIVWPVSKYKESDILKLIG